MEWVNEKAENMLRRLVKLVIGLGVLGFAGLAGYAFLGDLSPVQHEQKLMVTLDAD